MLATGVNHIILTVSDVERSRTFYGDVLGFETHTIMDEHPEYGFFFASGEIEFYVGPSRQPVEGDSFSEFRIGLDHVAFTAASREALDELVEKVRAAGSPTEGVETFAPSGNLYVAFRDPDNIQLEYWLP